MKAARGFPTWLIAMAATGLGFFAFVIVGGLFVSFVGRVAGGLWVMLVAALIGLAAAYAGFKYSRLLMMGQLSKAAVESRPDHPTSGEERKRRIARTLLFGGVILFPVFISVLLSSIMNMYA